MVGGSAFQHCEALETLVIPSDYDMTWNHDATIFYDTDSLTCYYGPDGFILPCSQCTDEHNETRPKCEETVELSVSTSSYSSTLPLSIVDIYAPLEHRYIHVHEYADHRVSVSLRFRLDRCSVHVVSRKLQSRSRSSETE